MSSPRVVRLSSARHAVYRLAPDLLLVFKPRGHREPPHRHAHAQRLTVLRGRLRVETARRTVVLSLSRPTIALAAGREHATEALSATWLIAERTRSRRASAARRERSPGSISRDTRPAPARPEGDARRAG